MALRLIPVDILTSSYRIVGKLGVPTAGVMGLLSDDTNSFMEIHTANMARIHLATKLAEQTQVVRVVKRQIVALCLTRREDVGPVTTMRGGYTRPYRYPIRVTTPIYELEGTLEWPGKFDFSAIMIEGKCDFVPVYDASLGAVLFPTLLIQSPVAIFNRAHLNTLILMGEEI